MSLFFTPHVKHEQTTAFELVASSPREIAYVPTQRKIEATFIHLDKNNKVVFSEDEVSLLLNEELPSLHLCNDQVTLSFARDRFVVDKSEEKHISVGDHLVICQHPYSMMKTLDTPFKHAYKNRKEFIQSLERHLGPAIDGNDEELLIKAINFINSKKYDPFETNNRYLTAALDPITTLKNITYGRDDQRQNTVRRAGRNTGGGERGPGIIVGIVKNYSECLQVLKDSPRLNQFRETALDGKLIVRDYRTAKENANVDDRPYRPLKLREDTAYRYIDLVFTMSIKQALAGPANFGDAASIYRGQVELLAESIFFEHCSRLEKNDYRKSVEARTDHAVQAENVSGSVQSVDNPWEYFYGEPEFQSCCRRLTAAGLGAGELMETIAAVCEQLYDAKKDDDENLHVIVQELDNVCQSLMGKG